MDLGLTEIQQMLKNSAREFLSQECPLTLVRELEESNEGHSEALWKQVVSLGWTGLVFPEEFGGTGANFSDLAVLLEEMGRSLLPTPFFSTVVLGGLTVLDTGSDLQKQQIIPKICDGSHILTVAMLEREGSYQSWGVHMTASLSGSNYVLNGTKLFVPDADVAHSVLVVARTTESDDTNYGITIFVVPMDSEGITVSLLSSIGGERQCEVVFSDVAIPNGNVIGGIDLGWPIVEKMLQRAVAANCIEMLGGAEAVLDMTVEYAKQRTQFGRPIGSFQAIQHHCANMASDVEGSRHMAYQAAWRISENLQCAREVSMAKVWVTGAYSRICSTAHQCHGAIGFTKEHNLQLYTRRAKVQQLMYGDVHDHKATVLEHIDD
mgnify:FL=1